MQPMRFPLWRCGVRRLAVAPVIAAACLCAAAAAHAGANNCSYNGREYAEGVVICQAGLRNLCMNGEWQSKDFCNGTPDGAIVGGNVGGERVIEVPVPRAAEVNDD